MALSKPDLPACATAVGAPEAPAPSTRQEASSVAPFQLAYTTVLPLLSVRAAPAGLVSGRPSHGASVARYVRLEPGSSPSNSSLPLRLYSAKYGSEPQPTNTLPLG